MPLGSSILTARRSTHKSHPNAIDDEPSSNRLQATSSPKRTKPDTGRETENAVEYARMSQRPFASLSKSTGSRLHDEMLAARAVRASTRGQTDTFTVPSVLAATRPAKTRTPLSSTAAASESGPSTAAASGPRKQTKPQALGTTASRSTTSAVATANSPRRIVQAFRRQAHVQADAEAAPAPVAVMHVPQVVRRQKDVANSSRAVSAAPQSRPGSITAARSGIVKREMTGDLSPEPNVARTSAHVAEDSDDSEADDDFVNWDGFQVSRALPRYDERRYTLRELMVMLDTPDGIDLDPIYQRGFVWNKERQVGLVDSIFQGYYIPGLIFNKQTRKIGSVRRQIMVCIDGKQRLTSVKHFTEGRFPCRDRHGQKWYFCRPIDADEQTQTRGRKYLPRSAQVAFWNKTFLCYVYVGMTDEQEHELFERVQRGNPLTTAEKSQAKKGPWQDLARVFEHDYVRVMKLSDTTRGAGHNKIMSSFVQILERDRAASEPLRPEQFKAKDYWIDKWFVKEIHDHPCTPELQVRFRELFDRFEEIARSKRAFANDGLKARATLAPIEFIAVARMIDMYPHKTNKELKDAIRFLRRKVRQMHDDNVRRKAKVWATVVATIDEVLRSPGVDGGAVADVVENDREAFELADDSSTSDDAISGHVATTGQLNNRAPEEMDEIQFAAPNHGPIPVFDDENDLDYQDSDGDEGDDDFVHSVAAFAKEARLPVSSETHSSPPVASTRLGGAKRRVVWEDSHDWEGYERNVRRRFV